jgi:hypothetical protein
MADSIIVSGVKPYDGRYELDLDVEMTTREWGWIKRLSGYLPGTMDDNSLSDPELACALAVIAMRRAGRIQTHEAAAVFDRLIDAPFGSSITLEGGPEETETEADASPPPRSLNGKPDDSGPNSLTSSEISAHPIRGTTGTPGSATSPSDPTTLAS